MTRNTTPMMKPTLLTLLLSTAAALAGESAKQPIPPPPASEPAPWNWFAGASAGYLADYEEAMYHLHLGIDFPPRGACLHSLFVEIGWTSADDTYLSPPIALGDTQVSLALDSEVEIVPLTLNYKFERRIGERFSGYLGVGAGIAFVDYESTGVVLGAAAPPFSSSGSDTVFAAQIFGGVVYQVSDAFELYGGVRWIHLDDADITTGPFGVAILEDDLLVETGFRFNF